MPNNFKNAKQICTTSLTDLYTCPNNVASVVLLLQATNVTNRADSLTVNWIDSTNSAVTSLTFQLPVPANQSVGCLTGKLVLEAGDKIQAQCGTHQALHLSFSALETS